jgi:hypothetical protein
VKKAIAKRLARLEAKAIRPVGGTIVHLPGDPEPDNAFGQLIVRVNFVSCDDGNSDRSTSSMVNVFK